MDVRIGVAHTGKELTLDIDASADDVLAEIRKQIDSGSPLVCLTDKRGQRVCVVLDKLAYVEVEGDESGRRVGFGP